MSRTNTKLTDAGITKTTIHDPGANKHPGYPNYTWQHIYKSHKGSVSLIYLATGGYKSPWEICSYGEIDLFEELEGYRSLKAAEARIMELLA